CAALDARLGWSDVCGLRAGGAAGAIRDIVSGLPSDAYGRGAVAPILPNAPTLFFRAGLENICASVAEQVIDAPPDSPATRRWSSADADIAITDFVRDVMALPASDGRAAPAGALLRSHFASAMEEGVTATDALRSTFVVACLAPSTVSIGL